MKRFTKILSLLAVFLLFSGCGIPPAETTVPTPPPETTAPPTTAAPTVPTTPDPTVPTAAESFVLSFAGDCTMGDNYDAEKDYGTFCKVVGTKYDYPFANVKDYFFNDDYSLVNLECALTESDPTEEEMEELKEHTYRFRGPAEYTQILIEGGVEFASCANNHSRDYGKQGLLDTWEALEEAELDYASFGRSCVTTTPSGLTVGTFAVFFNTSQAAVENQVKYLRDKGAEIVIMSIHWGDEGVYRPSQQQQNLGRMAIDTGVDIVFGHHSHTLMPVESYHGGIIYYSLGNFAFGGNRNPKDRDTAIFQQQVLRYADGTVALGDLTVIPCCVSSAEGWNNYQPTPYEVGSEDYLRVFTKLEGTFETEAVEVPELTEPTEPAEESDK